MNTLSRYGELTLTAIPGHSTCRKGRRIAVIRMMFDVQSGKWSSARKGNHGARE